MMSDEESDEMRIIREVIERHLSPTTGQFDMDSALAELKVVLDVPDESMDNLWGYIAKWVEEDYPPTRAQAARRRARKQQTKADELRSGPVVNLDAWRKRNELTDDDPF